MTDKVLAHIVVTILQFCHRADDQSQLWQAVMGSPGSCYENKHKVEQLGELKFANSLNLEDNLVLAIGSCSVFEGTAVEILVLGALADHSFG